MKAFITSTDTELIVDGQFCHDTPTTCIICCTRSKMLLTDSAISKNRLDFLMNFLICATICVYRNLFANDYRYLVMLTRTHQEMR